MRIFLSLLIFLCSLANLSAQPKLTDFFKPIPGRRFIFGMLAPGRVTDFLRPAMATSTDSGPMFGVVSWQIRPILSAATYTLKGNNLLTGTGVSYQWLSQDPTTGKWSSIVSFAILGYVGTPLDPSTGVSPVWTFGPQVGLLNNLLTIGWVAGYHGLSPSLTVGVDVSLNN